MKRILLLSLIASFLLSCQKGIKSPTTTYLESVRQGLANSLSAADFQALDFGKAARSTVDSVDLYFLRVPFRGRRQEEDFVMVQTSREGIIKKGKIIHLEGQIEDDLVGGRRKKVWNGFVSVASLDRKSVFQSAIKSGYVTAFHLQDRFRLTSHEADHVMPEVIITYTRLSESGSLYWSSWYSMHMVSWETGGWSSGSDSDGVSGGYYSDYSGGSTDDGYNGNDGAGGGNDPVIYVDQENQDNDAPIDVEKFINCFKAIPDAGATCSIEILADIPVDSDPNKIFDFASRSPGHTFINIRKSYAGQSVSQNIGFYPESGLKAILTSAPIAGKFVDNGGHEFNAAFRLSISPEQLNAALVQMQQAKNYRYDIDNYNCTDWALDVFNAAGGSLEVPLYDIPGNIPSVGTRMPNSVYNKLQQMKNIGDPRADGITIGIVKGLAGNSTGPCN